MRNDVLDKFKIDGKTAIVTGGATGLGKAFASALGEVGANVIIADKNLELAKKTANELNASGINCHAYYVDVTEMASCFELVEKIKAKFGAIDVLVNNAGIARMANAEDMSINDWNDVINVNLTGVFLMSQAVGHQMIAQNGGAIINISSMSGFIVNKPQQHCAYNAAKGGVIMLTKSLAAEWAKYNIRVNSIAPGYMHTSLIEHFFEKPNVVDIWLENTPMRRIGKPDELKGLVVYLASEASSFVTGSVFVVDGGYTIW